MDASDERTTSEATPEPDAETGATPPADHAPTSDSSTAELAQEDSTADIENPAGPAAATTEPPAVEALIPPVEALIPPVEGEATETTETNSVPVMQPSPSSDTAEPIAAPAQADETPSSEPTVASADDDPEGMQVPAPSPAVPAAELTDPAQPDLFQAAGPDNAAEPDDAAEPADPAARDPAASEAPPTTAAEPDTGSKTPSDTIPRPATPPPRPGHAPAPSDARPPLRRPVAAGQLAREPQAEGFGSGQLVSGTVMSVDGNEVVVDLGDRQGVIVRRHLTVDGKTDPTTVVSVGDTIEAAVLVREDPQNRVVLSRTWAAKQRAWQAVDEAQTANTPVRGTVLEAVKGGVVVDIGIRAFLPASQLDVVHVDDLNTFVGQEIEAMVAEADRTTDKIVLSRRALLRQHDRQRAGELLGSLAPGQVRRGRVATVTDFGAFVDLGGVRGLLHLSELSWERVERTTDVVNVGDEIDVKILSVKGGAKRISLSLRALSADPLNLLVEGQTLEGVVTRLVDFGAFVRVLDKVEGLVHVSELAEYRVHLPEEVVTPGDELWVKVLRIDRKRRRVDLSVTQAVQY
jgi:small subunit ribosomal protein S1